jgi:catechol 2,3-dioxygenase-like lactoylglutathione lyase family enzyme
MIHPVSLAHVNINVTDLERSEKFYTEVLGLQVAFKYPGAVAWLNFGQYREGVQGLGFGFHDIALYQVRNPLPEGYRKMAGLNHIAFQLSKPEEIDQALEFLRSKNVEILKGPLIHKEDRHYYLYFKDPDGNVIELVSSTIPGWPEVFKKSADTG